MPNEQEDRYVSLHKQLHIVAKQAAGAKQAVIASYLALHYPDLRYTLTIMDENVLAVDLVFPGLHVALEQQIVNEVIDYLNSLTGYEPLPHLH